MNRTVFIAGSDKNAGKTTMLNYLLRRLRPHAVVAFLSIGVDGETCDLVFGNPKPLVFTETGDFLATTEGMIEASDGLFEIREVFPFRTALGRIVAAKTLRGGQIELIGPETNDQLSRVLSFFRKGEGIETILVDGAAGRITQVASEGSSPGLPGPDTRQAFPDRPKGCPSDASGFVFVIKVSPGNINTALDKLRRLKLMEGIQPLDPHGVDGEEGFFDTSSPSGGGTTFFVNGALTGQKAETIPADAVNVVIDDFTKVFLDCGGLARLCRSKRLFFRQKFEFIGAMPILRDISNEEFARLAGDAVTPEKIILNPYLDEPGRAGAA